MYVLRGMLPLRYKIRVVTNYGLLSPNMVQEHSTPYYPFRIISTEYIIRTIIPLSNYNEHREATEESVENNTCHDTPYKWYESAETEIKRLVRLGMLVCTIDDMYNDFCQSTLL